MRELTPPIVIAGMHRSGTGLLVDLLSKCGGFFGARLDPNREDFFFLLRNEWVMRRAGGSWDYPLPTLRFLERPEFLDEIVSFFGSHVRSLSFSRYTGYVSYFSGRFRGGGVRPWGWKDPRNTFTFPIWQRIFPGARLLYIRRNGVDVANSLLTRSGKRMRSEDAIQGNLYRRSFPRRLLRAVHPLETFEHYLYTSRCFSLEASFRLWEEYVDRGERLFAEYKGPKIALQFEELCTSPAAVFKELADFCGLEGATGIPKEFAASLVPERAHAFLARDDLRQFYESVKDSRWMQQLGYGDLA